MKTRHVSRFNQSLASFIGCTMAAGFAASANAATVTDVTDWGTTPVEIVNAKLPSLDYSGGVYAGINTVSVTDAGADNGVYGAFCIDPFHWSAIGATPGYSVISLADDAKAPGELNTFTATEIGDLWAEFYSPTMSSPAAAGLQIAIWELVSSNAVADNGLPRAEAVTFSGNAYTGIASADIASLAGYSGPTADLEALTGPGQDYVVDIPPQVVLPAAIISLNSVPDGGGTFIMLALSLGALVLARSSIIERAGQMRKLQPIPVKN
jgi:hypothetical protein